MFHLKGGTLNIENTKQIPQEKEKAQNAPMESDKNYIISYDLCFANTTCILHSFSNPMHVYYNYFQIQCLIQRN